MKEQTLNGAWTMKEAGSSVSYPVQVPGTVLSCLIGEKVIPDPYYRMNEYPTRDLFYKDYEFSRTFLAGKDLLDEEVVELVCHSLDTFAEVFINGQLVASTDNMHRTWVIPVRHLLKEGENELRILFRSALKWAENYRAPEYKAVHYESPVTTVGNEAIRKAHSMFGWDWGAQLIDAGIQRQIELVAYSYSHITDVLFTQLHEEGRVTLKTTVTVEGVGASKGKSGQKVQLLLTAPDGSTKTQEAVCTLKDEKNAAEMQILIENPELWWPNGYGQHPLYEIKVTLVQPDGEKEEKEYRIGLRTLTVSQEKDEWGSEFAFCVNGIKIFAMGANYIPEDCVYPRITEQKLESLIRAAIRANYNCLRYWGGGYYPSDRFYELCDEYGLIIWQDLMFACNTYEFSESFEKSVTAEIFDNVKRLRHHACLGLWCGNNELETAWVNWTDFDVCNEYVRADYIKQFEYVLPKIMKEADSQTFYWPSSPSSGGSFDDPNSENRGDVHYWEVWHGQKPFTDYRNYFFRFCSEFGFQSFPCAKTVYTYTEPEDRNIFSEVMESHQKNSSANGKVLYYLSENFRYPKDFDSLLYVSQVLQANAMKYGVEHWRRNRGRCMGALYWQMNDEWPVASWSSIDYYGRWKALHYFARNFFEPLTGSLERTGSVVKVFLENETREDAACQITVSLKNMELEVLDSRSFEGKVSALSAAEAAVVDYSGLLQKYAPQEVFCEACFIFPEGRKRIETETFVPYKHLHLKKPQIQASVEDLGDRFCISLESEVFANYVSLELQDADGIFSDNFVAITDKKPVHVYLAKEDITGGSIRDAKELQDQLKLFSIRDSYI